ncbi:hypothetical protein Bhyg_02175 [Pseudolycoriella hygida]|uniref:Uncharacterized protein n=1 Tax=Pseudolycoriella hygida TaxID=35572 RepID=A0A9Q0S7I6_9DIPT|nr:hypothetical protein Bhyg_02175 [Pseudolycoriella hygida]
MIFGAFCLLVLGSADAASFGGGASSSTSSFAGTSAQGVNYGTTSGHTGSGIYSPGYPYTPVSTQQYSTQFYPNTNVPNNVNYQTQNSQYPNQFQDPNNYQNHFSYQTQFQNQFQRPQQYQQQQQFSFVPFQPVQFAPFFPAPFTPPQYQQAFAQFQNNLQQQIASLYNQQQEVWNQYQNGGGGGNSVPYYAPNYAAATATYSDDGIHQTASINPPNPNSPNIDNRFGASGPSDGNGFFGVSTSSFSSSSDVNGVKTNRKGAITSVNDNGKVTTYKVSSHYTSHQDSVQEARRKASERLQQQGVDQAYISEFASGTGSRGYGSGHHGFSSGNLGFSAGLTAPKFPTDPALCTVPCDSKQFGSSDVETFIGGGGGYVGYPSVGSSSSNFQSSQSEINQQAAIPFIAPSSGSNSKFTSSYVSETAQSQPTIVIPVSSGGSERSTSYSERISETKAAPIVVYPATGSESYKSRSERIEESKSNPVPLQIPYYPASGSSQKFSSHSERHTSQAAPMVPVYQPSGSHSHHFTEQNNPLHLQVLPQPTGAEKYSRVSEHYSQNSGVQVPLIPSVGTQHVSSSQLQNYRETNAQPYQPITFPGGSSSRYQLHEESVRESGAPQAVLYPTQSTSSRLTNQHISSSSTSNSQPLYVVPPSSASSHYKSESESYNSNRGGGYVPIPYTPSSSSSHYLSENSASSTQGGFGNDFGYRGRYTGGRDSAFNSQYGSSLFGSQTSSDLSQYMSESERLAREQARNVQSSGTYSGSALVGSSSQDINLTGGASGSGGLSGGSGGYTKVKSWENSSKWASGTQYDENGRPKTYSSLSTAESEDHNINGKSTSYKAATTTLEDDGKVSTYSIHT